MKDLNDKKVIVVGASRGLGRAIALHLAGQGAKITAVARSEAALAALKEEQSTIDIVVGDASDPTLSGRVLAATEPDALVIAAGAQPLMQPLRHYDWDAFARPFLTDTKIAFHWLKGCLNQPMPSGGRVVVFSSGAALSGSFLSGGYASAKQAQRFICNYAQRESEELELGLSIQCVLPQLNPNTRLGAAGVKAYARRAGETPEAFVQKRFGSALTPQIAAQEVQRMLLGEQDEHREFMLTGKGLSPLAP